jgi:hypothetical protein
VERRGRCSSAAGLDRTSERVRRLRMEARSSPCRGRGQGMDAPWRQQTKASRTLGQGKVDLRRRQVQASSSHAHICPGFPPAVST